MNDELKENYLMNLKNNIGDKIAVIKYNFIFGKNTLPVIEFAEDLDEKTKDVIKHIVESTTIFTFSTPGIESINMRTYRPGTISHFISLIPKFRSIGYTVEISGVTATAYQELKKDIDVD